MKLSLQCIVAVLTVCLLSACSVSSRSEPQIIITPIDDVPTAASNHCPLPLVYSEPMTKYRKIAIVEGYGAVGQDQEVIAAAQQAACETGADALLVVSSVAQDGVNLNPQIGQQGADALTRNSSDTAKMMLSGIHLKGEKPAKAGRAGFFLEEYAIVYGDHRSHVDSDTQSSEAGIRPAASYSER